MNILSKSLIASVLISASTIVMAAPAVHINSFNCNIYDGNGVLVTTTNSRTVSTMSEVGTVILKCMADVAAPNTGSAVIYRDLLCGSYDDQGNIITTNDGREVVSASGEAVLTCKFKTQ